MINYWRDILKIHNCENWLGSGPSNEVSYSPFEDCKELPPAANQAKDPNSTFDPKKLIVDPKCSECKLNFRDPSPKDLVMCLHALTYSGPGWSYSTEKPDWARDDWTL